MEAARTSETSVDNYFTRQYIPEDNSELHTRRRENLKSHIISQTFAIAVGEHADHFRKIPHTQRCMQVNVIPVVKS
jgi:hypothetical protein